MPKKKVIVEGQVIVTDKGTLKKTAKGAHSVDRRLKGAAKTSSNASKNFSKMSQGISGGLVPAYATLAASLFALDAVYRGLKEAADLRILQQGQMAFAAQTGMAMQSVTRNIQEATDSQISFKEASQAAAIGMAAGLSGEQMERLAAAATSAAKVLGRSVPDAFDRMTRGVIKAEPEVLDELGIILRLDTAAENYAQRLNISKDSLTVFEKSQAVLNEVLTQAETKYSDVAESIQPNTWQQFGTAMEKVKDEMMIFVDKILAPVAKFLSGNVWAAVGAMGIFISSVMKGLLPTYAEQKEKFVQSQLAQQQSIDATREKLKALKLQQQGMTEKGAMALGGAQKASMAGAPKDRRTTIGKLQRGQVISAKQASAEIVRIEKLKNQKVDGMTKKQSIKYKAYLAKIVAQDKRAHQKMAMHGEKHFLKTRMRWAKMQMVHKAVMGRMTQAANMFGRAASVAMSAFGWISMALMAFQAIKALVNANKEVDHAQIELNKTLEETNEKLVALNIEQAKILEQLPETAEAWTKVGQAVSFYANYVNSIPTGKLLETLLKQGDTLDKEFVENIIKMEKNLTNLMPAWEKWGLTAASTKKEIRAALNDLGKFSQVMGQAKGAVDSITNSQEKLNKLQKERVDKALKYEYKQEIDVLYERLRAYTKIGMLTSENQTELEETRTALTKILEREQKISNEKANQLRIQFQLKNAFGLNAKNAKLELKAELTRSKIQANELNFLKQKADMGEKLNATDAARLDILEAEKNIQNIILEADAQLNDLMGTLSANMTVAVQTGFGSGMRKGLEDMLLLKGDIGDLVVGVGKSIASSMAKTLSDQMVQAMGNKWEILKDPRTKIIDDAMTEIQTQQTAVNTATETLITELNKFAETDAGAKSFAEDLKEVGEPFIKGLRSILTDLGLIGAGGSDTPMGAYAATLPDPVQYVDEAKAAKYEELTSLRDQYAGVTAVDEAKDASTYGFGTKEGVSAADKEALIVKILAIEAEILALKEAKSKQGQGTSEGSRAHTGKIIKAKEDEIDALVDTTKTVKELNPALNALSEGATSVGKGLNTIWDGLTGGFWSKLTSGATGGYVTNKGIQGFAGGGKVPGVYKGRDTVPAMLSPGETVLTPGQLKGIGGSNTVVNVNMGEGGATISGQQSDSASAAAFGKAIAGAVNKEIAKQKRIGGTLYTQGPGGW